MEATQGYGALRVLEMRASKVAVDDTLRMTPLPGQVYGMFSSRAVEFTVYIYTYRCYVLLYVFFWYLLLLVPGKFGHVLSQAFLTGLHCSYQQTIS